MIVDTLFRNYHIIIAIVDLVISTDWRANLITGVTVLIYWWLL